VAFTPCKLAPGERPRLEAKAFGAVADVKDLKFSPLGGDESIILQQITLWSVSTWSKLHVNYDPAFLTGKEDVEFSLRLLAGHRNKIFVCRDLQIEKFHAPTDTRDQNPGLFEKDAFIREKIAQVLRILVTKERNACDLAKSYDIKTTVATSEDEREKTQAELLKRQNMVIEQFLTLDPNLALRGSQRREQKSGRKA